LLTRNYLPEVLEKVVSVGEVAATVVIGLPTEEVEVMLIEYSGVSL
jgi:hypothetical protein